MEYNCNSVTLSVVLNLKVRGTRASARAHAGRHTEWRFRTLRSVLRQESRLRKWLFLPKSTQFNVEKVLEFLTT
jgi:hypothetical protein